MSSKTSKKSGGKKPWEYVDYSPTDAHPDEIARKLIKPSYGVRKSDQQFNPGGVLMPLLLIFVTGYTWIWLASGASRKGQTTQEIIEATMAARQNMALDATRTVLEASITPTPTETPTETPTPSLTPTPTRQGTLTRFRFSWYNPNLLTDREVLELTDLVAVGGRYMMTANCWNYDAYKNRCTSPVASGDDWQDWLGTGAACGPSYEFGTILVLVDHDREFVCVDRGGAIGDDVIDFLLSPDDDLVSTYDWSDLVNVLVVQP